MTTHALRATAIAASLLATAITAHAADEPDPNMVAAVAKKVSDSLGIKLWGYMRSGFYSATNNGPKGHYGLGGDLQHFRLGNEGDNYIEFGIGKKFDLGGGLKWGTYYMPTLYNGSSGTGQVYTDISGLDFAPELTFWAGQRYHRIQDIHMIDNWVMEDGDNYGAGVDGFRVGGGALNVSIYTEGSAGNHNGNSNNGRRVNLQLQDLPVNSGGKLSLTAAAIRGSFAKGSNGGALGLLHNQEDFIVPGLKNSLFLQTSSGHASLNGKFYNLDNGGVAQPGARQSRVVDNITWQVGRFGGQAVVGYQTTSPSDGGAKVKDFSLGGRMSYGVSRNVKLLGELATTARKIDGQENQRLHKGTIAVAFAPNTDFWTRPEFRLYVTQANWNDAAGQANSSSFGAANRTNNTAFGVQVEAWW